MQGLVVLAMIITAGIRRRPSCSILGLDIPSQQIGVDRVPADICMTEDEVKAFREHLDYPCFIGPFQDRQSPYDLVVRTAVEVQGDYSGGTGLEQVARVMSLGRDFHGSEREVFLVGLRSFDAHSGVGMPLLSNLNADLAALHTDLTHLNLWDATAVTSISDFGRTITTNGQGTDHAWSGNTFIAGGSVKGGHIHGQYPDDLNPATSELEVGGGRGVFIPTTPWEGLWYGMAQWFGVAEDQMAEVLPNAANFPDTALHSRDEVFNS